jgi:hypothetical protein
VTAVSGDADNRVVSITIRSRFYCEHLGKVNVLAFLKVSAPTPIG